MRRILALFSLAIAALAACCAAQAAAPPEFEWKDGDRVVLIGDTLIERDQKYGYLETRITAQNPDKTILFRNLGWSGDTVFGHARASFGKPADGYKLLREHVVALRPTVLVIGYGMTASFDGEAGLPTFVSGLNTLLDAVTESKPRLIVLSPIAHEDLGRPLPDPSRHNRDLARYRDAIKKLADERPAWFIDLYEATLSARNYGLDPLTDNGIHPTAYGHWYFAWAIESLRTSGQQGHCVGRVTCGFRGSRRRRRELTSRLSTPCSPSRRSLRQPQKTALRSSRVARLASPAPIAAALHSRSMATRDARFASPASIAAVLPSRSTARPSRPTIPTHGAAA